MAQISPTPLSLAACRFGTTTVNAARREVLRDVVWINVGERAFDFANETAIGPGRISRTQFDPLWAEQAWDRTLTFLGRVMWENRGEAQ